MTYAGRPWAFFRNSLWAGLASLAIVLTGTNTIRAQSQDENTFGCPRENSVPGGLAHWNSHRKARKELRRVLDRVDKFMPPPLGKREAMEPGYLGDLQQELGSDDKYIQYDQDIRICQSVLDETTGGSFSWEEISDDAYFEMRTMVLEVLLKKSVDPAEIGVGTVRETILQEFQKQSLCQLQKIRDATSETDRAAAEAEFVVLNEYAQGITRLWPVSYSHNTKLSSDAIDLMVDGLKCLSSLSKSLDDPRRPPKLKEIRKFLDWERKSMDHLEAVYDDQLRLAVGTDSDFAEALQEQKQKGTATFEELMRTMQVEFAESESTPEDAATDMNGWLANKLGYMRQNLAGEYDRMVQWVNAQKPGGSRKASSDDLVGSAFNLPGWESDHAKRSRGERTPGRGSSQNPQYDFSWIQRAINGANALVSQYLNDGMTPQWLENADAWVRQTGTDIHAHSELFDQSFMNQVDACVQAYTTARGESGW